MAVLGIDIGTQSLKVAILDDALNLLGMADVGYRPHSPQPGWAEQSPQLWLDAIRPAIAAALTRAGLTESDIAALSVCGQLDGCIATDKGGAALSPALIWMDRRAATEIAAIDPKLVQQRCGLVLDPTHMAAKIAWLSRHHAASGAVGTWHQPVSFVVEALTGERAMSHSLASTTMLYNLAEREWDSALLAAFDVEKGSLPRLVGEAEIVAGLSARGARLTGLRPGTPVAAGTGDDFSNPLGSGICRPGIVAVSLGTAETVAALAARPIIDADLLVETHAYPGGLYHLGNPGWLCGGAVRWASALLGIDTDSALSDLAGTAPAGCDGLTFLPALTGAMSPKWMPAARGSFIGLSTAHGPSHLARAVLEGTAFAMRDVIDRLQSLGVETGRLRLMGGGTRSELWCQIRADVAGRPTDILAEGDASAIGAGLLAAVAAGGFADIQSAAASLGRRLREVSPRQEMAATYESAYRAYQARFAALEPTWTTLR